LVKLDSLPEDIYRLLEDKVEIPESILKKFGVESSGVLSKVSEIHSPGLRMSNVGKPLRQLYYDLKGYEPEKITGKTLLKFSYGHLIEAMVLAFTEAAGHTIERYQEEIEVDLIKGHIDGVISGILIDVKSCSPYSFQKFKTGSLLEEGQDPFGYVGQLCGYAHEISGEICVLHLPQSLIDSYDIKARIKTVREAVSLDVEPEKCYPDEPHQKSGNRKLSVGCSYCGHKFRCWRDSNNGEGLKVYQYSDKPIFLTNVAKEPRVSQFPIKKDYI
jgi:hypothetical protein